ncbi:uncharacterized protein LOC143257856, partial [Tachypleus tridentatus]|uniref:uncharacterized protein LOC143257856 n=1 Tax=Tachypleus tridentatus TaxID=6853 RepID=UPI003FD6109D
CGHTGTGGFGTDEISGGGFGVGGKFGTGGLGAGGQFGTGKYGTGGQFGTGGFGADGQFGTGGFGADGQFGTGGFGGWEVWHWRISSKWTLWCWRRTSKRIHGGGRGGGRYGQQPVYPSIPTPHSFSYVAPADGGFSARQEVGDGYGQVRGTYKLSDPDGRFRKVQYTAGPQGFQAQVYTNEPGTKSESPADVNFQSSAPVPPPYYPPRQRPGYGTPGGGRGYPNTLFQLVDLGSNLINSEVNVKEMFLCILLLS